MKITQSFTLESSLFKGDQFSWIRGSPLFTYIHRKHVQTTESGEKFEKTEMQNLNLTTNKMHHVIIRKQGQD